MKNLILIILFITSNLFAQLTNLLEDTNSKNFFIENKGQWPKEVKYLAKIGGMNAWITNTGVVYDFYKIKRDYNEEEFLTLPKHEQDDIRRENTSVRGQVVKSVFNNSNSVKRFIPENEQETYYNYFVGNDKSKWASYVKLYESVEIEELYNGIDVKYYFDEGLLRYDFIAKPGADINQIAMSFEGADNYSVNRDGELEIETSLGIVKHKDIVAYQKIDGNKEFVKSSFNKSNKGNVGFSVEHYDTQKELIIDPLIYSTYLGGSSWDTGYSIVVDNVGSVCITGDTWSVDFPFRNGIYTFNGISAQTSDIFVSKFSRGQSLNYSTFIGSTSYDSGYGIATDDSNNIFVTGKVNSPNTFPVTNTHFSKGNVFVIKLSANGRILKYSTCIGGNGSEYSSAIKLDSQNNIYITGSTSSSNFPTTDNAYSRVMNGTSDIFLTKISASGNLIDYSTFIGGSSGEQSQSLAIDSNNNIYLTGRTNSIDFPITENAYSKTNSGKFDVFVTKLNENNGLIYSTFIGGSNDEEAYSILLDPFENSLISGGTFSPDYPTVIGSFDETHNNNKDIFVTKLNSSGSNLIFSTFIGGNGTDSALDATLDSKGNIVLTGSTSSNDSFPRFEEGFNEIKNYQGELVVCKLNADGSSLEYSNTFTSDADGTSIAMDNEDFAYVTGLAGQFFYSTNGASFNGQSDVFLVKIEPNIYSLKLNTPSEDKLLLAEGNYNITWESNNIENITIEYSIDDGNKWEQIIESIPASDESYTWNVPNIVSENCKIRIRSTSNGTYFDESDNNFVIYNLYQITTPKLHAKFNISAENINISWTGGANGDVKIEYSVNNGATWQLIADNYESKQFEYHWNVSYDEAASTSTIVKITDVLYPELTATSENFTIYKFYLHSFPTNSGLSIGSIKEIIWDSELIEKINLDYSLDGGNEWIRIASNIDAPLGSYSWTIPNSPTTQARIRIVDAADTNIVSEKGNYTIFKEDIYARLIADSIIVQTPSYINVMFHALDDNYRGIPKERLLLYDFQAKENNTVISPAESRLQVGGIGQIDLELKTVLLLDNSTSVQPNLQNIKDAAIELINNKLPEQQFAIYVFSENPILVQDFTTNQTDLINAISSISSAFPTTNLYGSIITGLSRWEDSISLNLIQQGFLIVLTDGDDTQASSTLQQVLSARGNKKIYTVGLGNDLNTNILDQIGNAGSFVVSNINDLSQQFLQIQDELLAFSNSFYRLNYQSPKRGDNTHNLRVELVNNLNTGPDSYISANFNSKDFYSILPDITINSTPENPFGVDSLSISPNGPLEVNIETPFTFGHQGYVFTPSDPSKLIIEKVPQSDSEYKLKANGNSNDVVNLQIDDPANNYSKTLTIIYDLPVDVDAEKEIPNVYSLSQNYPNPFNPTTTIEYSIPSAASGFSLSNTTLKIYDVLGKEVETLVNLKQNPGNYKVDFNASSLPSGVYFYRLISGSFTETKKLILMK